MIAQTTNKKLLLFDLDGTLVLTGGAGMRGLTKTFSIRYNLNNPLENVTIAGNTDPKIIDEIFRTHLPHIPYTMDLRNQILEVYLSRLKTEVQESTDYRILPGVIDLLEACQTHPDLILGLGTGNLEKGAFIKLERGDLNKYFPFGGYASDSDDRTVLLKTAVQHAEEFTKESIDPAQVYVIGDTPLDIQHGKAIGAKTIAVATGIIHSFELLQKEKPDFLFEDLSNTQEIMKIFIS